MRTNRRQRKANRGIRLSINWPLWLGILFVGTIVYLAIIGPTIAPKDPSEENLIVKDAVSGEWHIPPFAAFTVTGFPLGSDEFGRDIYSRLLYAVRPTLQMVLLVAGVRLVLGTLIGLVAGYSRGRIGSLFDSMISSALALPGLLVALGAIAIVGVELGVLAFVIGLSLTGWAETARLVREQTRAVRNEVYVEAAYAMGASDTEVVFRHVLRQIRSMLLMLLAFEIGSTLMLTAGLGFLGYYIGGDVWVDVDDFVARRTSGTPELGQMLATAWVRLTDPWGLVSVGSVVFSAVLGFNLIGEGLRLRLSPEIQTFRFRRLNEILARIRLNLEEVWHPIGSLLFGSRIAVTAWIVVITSALGYGTYRAWERGLFQLPEPEINMFFEENPVETPTPSANNQAGSNSEEDSSESQTISAEPIGDTNTFITGEAFTMPTEAVPLSDPVIYWSLDDDSGFAGNPAIDNSGNAYIGALGGKLYAIQPDGTILWQQDLDPAPTASPTIAADSILYIPDRSGGVSAFSLDGELLWQYEHPEDGYTAVSQVVLDETGMLYYTISRGTSGLIQSLTPDGDFRWLAAADTPKFFREPIVSANGRYIFLADNIFDRETGEFLVLTSEFDPDQFFAGANGKNYMISGSTVFEWQRNENTIEIMNTIRAAGVTTEFGGIPSPLRVFVTEDETFIFVFRGFVLWEDSQGELIHEASTPQSHFLTRLIGLDEDNTLQACGQYRYSMDDPLVETCMAFSLTDEHELWKIDFGSTFNIGDSLAGVSRTPGGFVFVSRLGTIYGVLENAIAQALDAQAAQADLEGATITATGSGWIFNTPTELLIAPLVHPDGSTYLLTEDNIFYVLDTSGNVQHVLELPEPIYVLEERTFGGGNIGTPFPPILAPEGGVVVASSSRLYAIGLDGTVTWDVPLDDVPHAPPLTGEVEGLYYLLDRQGSLYTFTPTDGLLWKHDLEEGLRPAYFFPVFSSTGEVYYSITNGTRGQIEALAPDGSQLWRTPLTTFKFFRPIQITPDGEWISIDDNVVRADTGELIELVDPEFLIDQFAMGLDGNTYLLSGSTVMQWELLPSGRLDILQQVTIAFPPNATRGLPPRLSITEDGTIWIDFVRAGGRSRIYNWVDFEGTIFNQITVDFADEFIVRQDLATVGLTICSLVRPESQLICRGFDKSQPDPTWEITIEGIPRADRVLYQEGRLFVQTSSTSVQIIDVELPE